MDKIKSTVTSLWCLIHLFVLSCKVCWWDLHHHIYNQKSKCQIASASLLSQLLSVLLEHMTQNIWPRDLTLDSLLCNQLLKRMSKAAQISLENVSFLTVGSGALSKLARYSKILSLKWHSAGGRKTKWIVETMWCIFESEQVSRFFGRD